MTQARKLKKTIRARARRTGESYAAARLQVLKHRNRTATPKKAAATAKAAPMPDLPPMVRKSEPRLVERTGHGWVHWFAVLDAFGAKEKGHTASARHLAEDHGVDGWYSQQITVHYERARGLRTTNQRMSGDYEVSVSKLLPANVATAMKALRDPRARKEWITELEPSLRAAFEAGLQGPKGLRERPQGGARMRFKTAEGQTVALYLDPRPDGRSVLVAQNLKLKAQADIPRLRTAWKPALAALARHLAR